MRLTSPADEATGGSVNGVSEACETAGLLRVDCLSSVATYLQSYFSPNSSGYRTDLSGASAVAIDHKIEQAMDLVKSHLIFAVREEIDTLREQINSLIERNRLLEYENRILRAAALPEALAQLQQHIGLQQRSVAS